MAMPSFPQRAVVPIFNPAGNFRINSNVEVFPGQGMVVVAANTTRFGKLHGAYSGVGPLPLGLAVGRHALETAGLSPDQITDLAVASSVPTNDSVFLGTSIRYGLGATGVVRAPVGNSLCASGMEAIAQVSERISRREKREGVGLAIGVDDQSWGRIALDNRFRRILALVTGRELPMEFGLTPEALQEGHPFADFRRFGISPQEFADAVALYVAETGHLPGRVTDGIAESFRDSSVNRFMWDTAAAVAKHFGVTDEEAIAIARRSHRNYWRAKDRGTLEGFVVVVPEVPLAVDENPSRNPPDNVLGRGPTAPGVHSGTSSQMAGGASAVAVASAETAKEHGLPVLAEVVAYAFSEVPPGLMGLGPISAAKGVLDFAGLTMDQVGFIEVNEAFAGVVSAFTRYPPFGFASDAARGVFPENVNPYGGAIALGHVMGATFGRMVAFATRFFELNPDKEYALVALCGGGGQGASLLLRNPNFRRGGETAVVVPRGFDLTTERSPDETRLFELLQPHGYLTVPATFAGISAAIDEIMELGRELPEDQDIRYVLAKEQGSLSPNDLLLKASEVRVLREQSTPGRSPTIGQSFGVVGAGEMGHQLALELARAEYHVVMTDLTLERAEAGRTKIFDLLYQAVERGLYTAEEAARVLARIHTGSDIVGEVRKVQAAGDTFELIVDSVAEDPAIKQGVFDPLREMADPYTILVTNTSSIPAGEAHADAVLHFFNPTYAMGLVDGSFVADLPEEKRERLAKIAFNLRKAYLPIEVDAPGGLVDPFFAATYFPADMLPQLEEELRGKGVADPRPLAAALLDALYVEAIRGEPEPLDETLARPFNPGQVGKAMRRGGQGLFRLVDNTGGPHTYVVAADNIAKHYGPHLASQEVLRQQDADWKGKNCWRWYPDVDKFRYADLVAAGLAELRKVADDDFIQGVRERFHRQFWARVMGLMGKMHDEGVVPETDPALVDIGVGLGLGWQDTPEAWLRRQPSLDRVAGLVRVEGLPVPRFFESGIDVSDLPPIVAVRLAFEGEGRIARVRFDRPHRGNAMNQDTFRDLLAHADAVSERPGVELVVLEGAGKGFVGGADVNWFYERQRRSAELKAAGDEVGAEAELAQIWDHFASKEIEAVEWLRGDDRLVVAVVQGNSIGGGVEVVAQADVVIILGGLEGAKADFWMPETTLGIGPGLKAHVNLVKKVGRPHATRILLTGPAAKFGADEALQMGLADRVVRRDKLSQVLAELATAWQEAKGRGVGRDEFVQTWRGERPPPSGRLVASERLWRDQDVVEVMALGVVPPWLTGREKKLAEAAVRAIRKGSPEAVWLVTAMLDLGSEFDLREGLVKIFNTDHARMAIGAFVGANKGGPFRWPYNAEIAGRVRDIAARHPS